MECAGRGAFCRPPVQMPHSASRAWDERLRPPVLTHPGTGPALPLTPLEVARGFQLAHHCLTPSHPLPHRTPPHHQTLEFLHPLT